MGTETALIFGSVCAPSWAYLDGLRQQAPLVICADGGVNRAREAGFKPDFYIGDGDSGGQAGDLEAVLLPTQKDLTDMQAACLAAAERGAKHLILTACTGGRQDHHLANLQLLETLQAMGLDAVILDACNEIRFITPGRYRVNAGAYRYFSLIPVTPTLEGLSITGAKYPLDRATARRGDSLTVSNEVTADYAEVVLWSGAAWLIRSEPCDD